MTSLDATDPLDSAEGAMVRLPHERKAAADGDRSYGDILKSSALIGMSTAINIVFGMIRTKAMAVLLGPGGYGIYGGFSAIADLSRNVGQLGINSSGVRQIAESAASGDLARVSMTSKVLRRVAASCAVLAAAALALGAGPVAELTFGDAKYASSVAMLSLAVLLGLLATGEIALLQGLRRIGDLARINVLGAFFGTVTSIPLVYFFGESGIVASLVVVAAASTGASWWFGSKVDVQPVTLTGADALRESTALLRLGIVFMCSGLLTMGAAYIVRVLLLRKLGPEAAGLYQAAWTLGGLYIGFVLQAMGTDFYPKLVGSADNHPECNRLVNEQARISLLLAMPGVLGTLALAPLAISIFYASSFGAATPSLRWICLGMAMRVLTWPLGYIAVAKNRQKLFFATDLAWTLANLALTWIFVERWGATGAGVAFFASYLLHWMLVYPIARHLSGFAWTRANVLLISLFLGLIAAVFAAEWALPPIASTVIGVGATLATTYFSARTLVSHVSPHRLPTAVLRLLNLRGRP